MKINFPLLALAVGAFAIGTTEFSPMGFLPEIANDLSVSIPQAGLLISAYAVGVMIGAPLMTLWLARFPQENRFNPIDGYFHDWECVGIQLHLII